MTHIRSTLRAWFLLALAVSIFPAPVPAGPPGFRLWNGARFRLAEERVLAASELPAPGPRALDRSLDMTVLFMSGTPWTQARALRQIRLTGRILGSCGIALGSVRLVRLAADPRDRRFDATDVDPETGVPSSVSALAGALPASAAYPVAFLIGRVDGVRSLAVSYRPAGDDGPAAPYLNTAWISYPAHWHPRADQHYSPLAHEIGHLLCRCGHTPSATRHLLHSSRNFLASHVLPEHCERFRSSPLLSVSD